MGPGISDNILAILHRAGMGKTRLSLDIVQSVCVQQINHVPDCVSRKGGLH